MSSATAEAQTAQVIATSGDMASTSGALTTAATGGNASPTPSANQASTTAGANAQFPMGEAAQNSFSNEQQQTNMFPAGTEGLTSSSPNMFLQTDDPQQQQQQVASTAASQQPIQRPRTKPVYTQATQQAAHLAASGTSSGQEHYMPQQQFAHSQKQETTSQPMQQMQTRTYGPTEQRVSRAGTFVQNEGQQQQQVDASVAVANVAGAAQEAFNAAQIGSTTVPGGPQFGFDDNVRRRQVANEGGAQHPAVVLGLGEYMGQQEGGRVMGEQLTQENANFPARFEGDPTLVGTSVVYEESKRAVGALPEGALPNQVTVPNQVPDGALPNQVTDPSLAFTGLRGPVANRAVNQNPPRTQPTVMPYTGETVDKCVECDVCGSLFGDAGSLKRHAARAHRAATGKGPVYCSQCSASLKNEQNLRRHIAVCHSGNQENRCDMCSASFSSRGSLRIHQQSVHSVPGQGKAGGARNGARVPGGPNVPGNRVGGRPRGAGVQKSNKSEKSYLCDMCTDTFKWKGNLKRHRELRHLQLRPFECHVCHANFGTKSNMRVHLITHNNAPVPK